MLLTRAFSSGLPTLYLDFLSSESLDSRITASGGTGGTRVNSAGLIVPASAPRFDYDPITLAARGLLIEEQRTNLLLRSAEFDNASWTKLNATATGGAATGPDGTASADSIAPTASTATHAALQTATVTASTTYTATVYMKAAGATHAQLVYDDGASNGAFMNLNLSTGAITRGPEAAGTGTQVAGDVQSAGNGWYRVRVTAQHGSTTARVAVNPLVSSASASGIFPSITTTTGDAVYLWGAQLEAGPFATSYIPTTTAQVTRTADSLVMTGANFSSWFNAVQGTIYAEADSVAFGGGTGARPVFELNDGTSNNRVTAYFRSGAAGLETDVMAGGVNQAALASQVGLLSNTVYKLAAVYAANDFAFAVAAGAVATDSAGSVPAVTQLLIGATNAAYQNGHLRTLRYYPRRLPDTTLQALTT
jgi:hypothetical protein